MSKSCLYVGQVRHRRFAPKPHHFNYRLFLVYLDLSELPTVFDRFWLWSIEKVNIASFKRKHHLGRHKSLDKSVRDYIELETGVYPEGPIRLLTHLHYYGFGFNPVSFYYCFDKEDQEIEFIIAEVNNTPWGEQHCYLMNEKDNLYRCDSSKNNLHRYQADKCFHVSPFMPMDMQYDWVLSSPADDLSVHMSNYQNNEKVFDATLRLQRQSMTSKNLAVVLLTFPFITLKVVLAIYYQAFRLWLKRVPFINHPKSEAPDSVKSV